MATFPTSWQPLKSLGRGVLGSAAALFLASCQPVEVSATALPPDPAACRITSVVDGDTLDMTCAATGPFRARLTGFDTPESFEPGCAAEARVARQATQRLRALVAQARTMDARIEGTDRFGRRLVRLSLDSRDVGAVLIAEGLAAPYDGGRRIDWCARLT
jgi:endonuclease YncB( thermonuclease family)